MTYPYTAFREEIHTALARVVRKEYGTDVAVRLEAPSEHADAAFPCFSLAGVAKASPQDIARRLAAGMEGEWIDRVEAVNGYLNFFIDQERLGREVLSLVDAMGDRFGALEDRGTSVIVEHTSANPNGPLHVGRARNPIIGDTLARLFRWAGYRVETQFYVDDMGKQVATLLWGIRNLDLKTEGDKEDHRLVAYYQRAHARAAEDEEVDEQIRDIIRRCEEGDPEALGAVKEAYRGVLAGILQSLERINISIDSFVEESRFVREGTVQQVIQRLQESPYAGREGGALYLDLEPFGVHGRNKKFFLTRTDGTSLYATRDIAYHLWKAQQADRLVNVLGEDHKLEARLVEIALTILGATVPVPVFYSFVSLPEGKMSTRRGRVVHLDDLIEEAVERAHREVKKRRELPEETARHIAEKVGTGAIRYNIVKVRPEKAITFRWEEALNFEGQSAPFIQYAHARCCSILRKAGDAGVSPLPGSGFDHLQEIRLLKTIALFPDVVESSSQSCNPAALAEYAHTLAADFNLFYRDCQVLGSGREEQRLALVRATRVTLRNALELLGIAALDEM